MAILTNIQWITIIIHPWIYEKKMLNSFQNGSKNQTKKIVITIDLIIKNDKKNQSPYLYLLFSLHIKSIIISQYLGVVQIIVKF